MTASSSRAATFRTQPGTSRMSRLATRASAAPWSDVPWRTIVGAVGVVVATYVLIVVLLAAAAS